MTGHQPASGNQLSLNVPDFAGMIRRVDIWEDYGPITTGSGASQPHYAGIENGTEYLIKGPSLTPLEPFVAVNELVSAMLAQYLQLPILEFALAKDVRGNLFFASRYLNQGQFHPVLTEQLLDSCDNRERIYDVVAFDIWLWNTDRHTGNFLVREDRSKRRLLLLNDHSRCLVQPADSPQSLLARAKNGGIAAFRRTSFLWERITEPHLLSEAISDIEGIQEATIGGLLQAVPTDFLDVGGKDAITRFLIERKDVLRDLVRTERSEFSKLRSGLI